jgi:hypothetical protein
MQIKMQPHKKKVAIMAAVSLGIIALSFLIPVVIIPAIIGVSSASNCAISTGCAGDTYDKCGAYQSSGESSSFTDSLDRGMKGMLCMMGLDNGKAAFALWLESHRSAATLNKIPFYIQ